MVMTWLVKTQYERENYFLRLHKIVERGHIFLVLVLSFRFPFSSSFVLPFSLLDMEGFVDGERSQVVSQGEAALIFPPQIHSFPRPGITWFRDGRKIPPSSRM